MRDSMHDEINNPIPHVRRFERRSFADFQSPQWDFAKPEERQITETIMERPNFQSLYDLMTCLNAEPFGGAEPGTVQCLGFALGQIGGSSRSARSAAARSGLLASSGIDTLVSRWM